MSSGQVIAGLGVALAAALIAVFLKESRFKTAALLVSLSAGAILLLRALPGLQTLITSFSALGQAAQVDTEYLALLIKIIGLAYIAEFGSQLCRDAGEGALAMKIELLAKLAMLLLALPVLAAIIRTVLSLLG